LHNKLFLTAILLGATAAPLTAQLPQKQIDLKIEQAKKSRKASQPVGATKRAANGNEVASSGTGVSASSAAPKKANPKKCVLGNCPKDSKSKPGLNDPAQAKKVSPAPDSKQSEVRSANTNKIGSGKGSSRYVRPSKGTIPTNGLLGAIGNGAGSPTDALVGLSADDLLAESTRKIAACQGLMIESGYWEKYTEDLAQWERLGLVANDRNGLRAPEPPSCESLAAMDWVTPEASTIDAFAEQVDPQVIIKGDPDLIHANIRKQLAVTVRIGSPRARWPGFGYNEGARVGAAQSPAAQWITNRVEFYYSINCTGAYEKIDISKNGEGNFDKEFYWKFKNTEESPDEICIKTKSYGEYPNGQLINFSPEREYTLNLRGKKVRGGPPTHRREFTIIALGDSYGSGEGNPWEGYRGGDHDDPNEDEMKEQVWWQNNYFENPASNDPLVTNFTNFCHRSSKSGTAKVAKEIEEAGVRVNYASFACSGAESQHLYYARQDQSEVRGRRAVTSEFEELWREPESTRRLVRSPGANESYPGNVLVMPPQIAQANAWLRRNEIERDDVNLVLVSIGGNNAKFGKLIKECIIKPGNCYDNDYDDDIQKWKRAAKGKVEQAVYWTAGIIQNQYPRAKIIFTDYPQAKLCNTPSDPPFPEDPNWDVIEDDQTFLNEVNKDISDGVRSGVRMLGTTIDDEDTSLNRPRPRRFGVYATDMWRASEGKSFCEPERIINFNDEAEDNQGSDQMLWDFFDTPFSSGGWHPNDRGYKMYAEEIKRILRENRNILSYEQVNAPNDVFIIK